MSCIKTGCVVKVGKEIYIGDLFVLGGCLILKGVPPDSQFPFTNQKFHCEANEIDFMTISGTGYSAYDISDSTVPTDEFYEYLSKWSPNSTSYFKRAKTNDNSKKSY